VPGGSATTNTAAIQAAHDALPAAGGRLIFPRYGYHINGVINITKSVTIRGPGTAELSVAPVYVLYLDTNGQTGFNVTAKAPFSLQDFSVAGTTGTTGVFIDGPTGALKGAEFTRFDNVLFISGAVHIDIASAFSWVISRSTFWGHTVRAIVVKNNHDNDQGDAVITSSMFLGDGVHIYQESGGGLKVLGNKFLAGLSVQLQLNRIGTTNTSDLLVLGNSFEGYVTAAIQFLNTSGVLTFKNIVITGNQIANVGGVFLQLSPTTNLFSIMSVTGNTMENLTTAFLIDGTDNITISGNVLNNISTAYSLGSTTTNLVISGNSYKSVTTLFSGTLSSSVRVVGDGSVFTVSTLPALANGSIVYCSDGTIANPVAGGGTGCIAKRLNGIWVGN
jgi:hypothetical protein